MLHHLLIIISLTTSPWCLCVYRYVVNSIMPALCCILDVQANGKATICQCQYLHSPTRMISSGGEQVLSHLAGLHDHSLISTPHTVHADVSNKHCLLLPESPYVLVLTAANTWCGLGRPSPCCPADVGVLQLSERVAVRREKRWAAEAVQQALLEAKAQEQEQFELIKAEFGVDTATVRSACLWAP